MSPDAIVHFCKSILDAGTTSFEAIIVVSKELNKDLEADWRSNPSIILAKVTAPATKATIDMVWYAYATWLISSNHG